MACATQLRTLDPQVGIHAEIPHLGGGHVEGGHPARHCVHLHAEGRHPDRMEHILGGDVEAHPSVHGEGDLQGSLVAQIVVGIAHVPVPLDPFDLDHQLFLALAGLQLPDPLEARVEDDVHGQDQGTQDPEDGQGVVAPNRRALLGLFPIFRPEAQDAVEEKGQDQRGHGHGQHQQQGEGLVDDRGLLRAHHGHEARRQGNPLPDGRHDHPEDGDDYAVSIHGQNSFHEE